MKRCIFRLSMPMPDGMTIDGVQKRLKRCGIEDVDAWAHDGDDISIVNFDVRRNASSFDDAVRSACREVTAAIGHIPKLTTVNVNPSELSDEELAELGVLEGDIAP